MRAVHRWIMTVGAVLVIYWAVTGVTLALVDISDPHNGWANDGGGPGSSEPTSIGSLVVASAGPLDADEIGPLGLAAIQAIRRTGIEIPIAALQLYKPNGQTRAVVTLSNPASQRLLLSLPDGQVIDAHAPSQRPGNDPAASLHSQVKNWHRGTVGNGANGTLAPGNLLAFAAGLTLLGLTVSGIVLYLRTWAARRRSARPAFFWSEGRAHRWRRLHRWIAIVAAAFLLNQSITGTLLATENILEQFHNGTAHAAHPYWFDDAELISWLQESYRQARAAAPSAPIISVLLRRNDGEPFAAIYLGGQHPGAFALKLLERRYIFGASGPATPGDVVIDRHSLLKRIHRGDWMGVFAGRYLTLAAGLCLLYLLGSGIWMYVDLKRSRQRLGRSGWFWR